MGSVSPLVEENYRFKVGDSVRLNRSIYYLDPTQVGLPVSPSSDLPGRLITADEFDFGVICFEVIPAKALMRIWGVKGDCTPVQYYVIYHEVFLCVKEEWVDPVELGALGATKEGRTEEPEKCFLDQVGVGQRFPLPEDKIHIIL